MATVKRSNTEKRTGRVNLEKLHTATERQKILWDKEDDVAEEYLGPERFVIPNIDVKALRHRFALSQEAFADVFRLSLRTVQEWEQERREPSEAARVLLFAIANSPKELAAALRARPDNATGRMRLRHNSFDLARVSHAYALVPRARFDIQESPDIDVITPDRWQIKGPSFSSSAAGFRCMLRAAVAYPAISREYTQIVENAAACLINIDVRQPLALCIA